MSKYLLLVLIFSPLIVCCTSADDTTTDNEKELQRNIKNKKDVNVILFTQDRLNALRNFLTNINKDNKTKDNKTKDNKNKDNKNKDNKKIDPESISLIIKDIDSANNILDNIKQNRYDGNSLEIKVKSLNNKIKQIETLSRKLFNLTENDNNKRNALPKMKNNTKAITNLNWIKDTRNNSHVITNPLKTSEVDPACIIVDLSQPLDLQQVQEYYDSYSPQEDKVPEQGTLPIGKLSEDISIGKRKLRS